MMAILIASVLPWLLIAVGTWLGYQLVRQNGRILLRLESIEKHVRHRPTAKQQEAVGLPVGTLAPDFELPDLMGFRRKLSEFRGKNVVLMFFNPQCGFCTQMAADLAALPHSSGIGAMDGEWSVPIVVTTGDAEENRKLVAQYGIRCVVLLQEQMEVASKYGAQGTPMGYRIDGAGRIASELAVGAEPLLQLATTVAVPQLHSGEQRNGSPKKYKKNDPSLAKSRLNRNGLKAGTTAPDFRLPRIDGGELSLAEFRGRRVLLVFSDPECGPCDELAPRLQQIHSQRSDLQVLMVSRRDIESNRTKATRLGLRFPIVVQKQWEISLKYAMFATPIGYLIDEQGTIASDVAVGIDPILALADGPAQSSNSDPESPLTTKEDALAI
jgi:peroxiredoxin